MSEWQRCYEEPRAFSWRENIDGEIIVVRADNHVERLPRDEFFRRYTLRRPAPAEYRDDLRKAAAEIERLRGEIADYRENEIQLESWVEESAAEIERLRARIAELESDRRERIATACLAGLMADPNVDGGPDDMADCAVRFGDALIACLDKEAKP